MTTNSEAKLVALGDVCLRVGDRALLDGQNWLNDQLIGFWFEYLAREVFSDQPLLLLIGGAEAFAIMNCGPEAAPMFLEPRHFDQCQLVLLAVSNNPNAEEANGGSHWSLLAYWRPRNTFLHFDSAGGMNTGAAQRLFDAMRQPGSRYQDATTPQQRNGWECGLVVLAMAELLCERFTSAGQQMSFTIKSKDLDVDDLRQRMRNVIDGMNARQ